MLRKLSVVLDKTEKACPVCGATSTAAGVYAFSNLVICVCFTLLAFPLVFSKLGFIVACGSLLVVFITSVVILGSLVPLKVKTQNGKQ